MHLLPASINCKIYFRLLYQLRIQLSVIIILLRREIRRDEGFAEVVGGPDMRQESVSILARDRYHYPAPQLCHQHCSIIPCWYEKAVDSVCYLRQLHECDVRMSLS